MSAGDQCRQTATPPAASDEWTATTALVPMSPLGCDEWLLARRDRAGCSSGREPTKQVETSAPDLDRIGVPAPVRLERPPGVGSRVDPMPAADLRQALDPTARPPAHLVARSGDRATLQASELMPRGLDRTRGAPGGCSANNW